MFDRWHAASVGLGFSGRALSFARGAFGGLAGLALLGLFEPVALAFEGDDLGLVHQRIDKRHDAGGVGKTSLHCPKGLLVLRMMGHS